MKGFSTRLVSSTTGGYELLGVAALVAAGLPVAVVNPRQVQDFARSTGQLAKTNRLDADMLAKFADRVRPTVRHGAPAISHRLSRLAYSSDSC